MRKIRTADGRTISLTDGEVNALKRMVSMNGTSTEKVQYDPGHVRYDTKFNLVRKGVLRRDDRGLFFLASGVFSA